MRSNRARIPGADADYREAMNHRCGVSPVKPGISLPIPQVSATKGKPQPQAHRFPAVGVTEPGSFGDKHTRAALHCCSRALLGSRSAPLPGVRRYRVQAFEFTTRPGSLTRISAERGPGLRIVVRASLHELIPDCCSGWAG